MDEKYNKESIQITRELSELVFKYQDKIIKNDFKEFNQKVKEIVTFNKNKNTTNPMFETIVIIDSKYVPASFFKIYHYTLFIFMDKDIKIEMNDDCKSIDASMYLSSKGENLGVLSHIIYQCHISDLKFRHLNVYSKHYKNYKGLFDIAGHYHMDLSFISLDKQTNTIINQMKKTEYYPKSFALLKKFIQRHFKNDEEILYTLLSAGFCWYSTKYQQMVYIKELV